MKNYRTLMFGLFFIISVSLVSASNPHVGNEKNPIISGSIKDAKTGEQLLGATVFIKELKSGVASNMYGFYSLSIPPGNYTLLYSYIGYESYEKKIQLKENTTLNIELQPKNQELKEVVIKEKRNNENVKKNEMSVVRMDAKTIRKIPAFMGEVDVIKALQLLPGIQTTSEGSSGFSVRGGSPDQNLILLDEATVYNASHLLGFFSVFNNDAIKDVKIYKGDIPMNYGGRLSSVLDVRMNDGNQKKFSATGGIGTISSRLTIEGPLLKDKTSFIISGRRTYFDLFLPLSPDENIRKNVLYFYDFNAKISHTINENNRLYISGYFGRDVFNNDFSRLTSGNQTFTMRWNHLFSKKLFTNFMFVYSKYDYFLGTPEGEANSFEWLSKMRDYGLKADFTLYSNPNNTIKFGIGSIYHIFDPGMAKGTGSQSLFNEFVVPSSYALENGVYLGNEQKINNRIELKYGLRFSMFQNIGAATIYNYNSNFESIDSTVYKSGDFYKTYSGLEPRVGIAYTLNEESSVKLNYSRTYQYIQLAQNSTSGTPLDVWFPASPNVKPQRCDQVALGYFRNFLGNYLETSIEVYYKKMSNSIDFKDHANLLLNQKLEGELRIGDATSRGLEVMVKIPEGRVNGWISYTLSKTDRIFPEINNGNTYLAYYDKPHNLAIVFNYEISKRTNFSANWIYYTGSPVTFPTGRAEIGGKIVPIYSDRNAYRMPDYHRLDLALTLKSKQKPNRKWSSEWVFSLYNAYGRKNAWAINFRQDKENPEITYAEKTYLFSFIPAITYNFKF
ncbi:MAG: TonB-dependent receptor [Bacteroidales bacterium]